MKNVLIVIGGIILLIIVVVAFVGGDTVNNDGQPEKVGEASETSGKEKTTKDVSGEQAQKEFKVGDKVKLDDAVITVNKVEFSQGGQFSKPAKGNEWVNLNVTVENTGSTEQYLTTFGQMFVRDGEANSYQEATTNKTVENINQMLDGTILAKSKRTGWVGFEIKKSAKGLQFQYKDSLIWGQGTIIINLGR